MKNPPRLRDLFPTGIAAVALLAGAMTAHAQTLVYSEDFETDHSLDGTWVTNSIGGYNPANLYFDYSTVGIPQAPNSTGVSRRGLKLQANLDSAVAVFPSGVSVSPSGFSITDNFEMTWDWWLNYNGPLNGGGLGSTQIGGAGFGTAGTSAQIAGGVIDCFFVGASGDGAGTSADYRVYTPSAQVSHQDTSGVYAAGNVTGVRNNSHPYYQSTFPPQSATNNCPDQLTLYPQQTGETQGGSAGMKWRSVQLRKVGNIITYTMDGLLIATIDVSTNGTFGGNNIVFGHFDINASASADPNATNLAFSLVDNIRITNFANVVTVTSTVPTAAEAGSVAGVFTIQRTQAGVPLTVNYTMSGGAENGVDYTNALGGALSGSVTFAASAIETNITIVPIDDNIPEALETVVLTITASPNYIGAGSASLVIVDNEPAQLAITNISTQMYERTNDYAIFRISRLGDTGTVFNVNLSFSGSATENVDYYTDGVVSFESGVIATNFSVYPIADAAYEGGEMVTANIAPAGGGEYTIGVSSASILLVDANTAPETVLFSEDFNVDNSANWTVFEASANGIPDFTADFNFPYTGFGIPEAPLGGGNGLYLTANKSDGTASGAAVNVYPIGAQNFSGNYALRFNMFVSVPIPSGTATEAAIAGINHSGTKTNWFVSGGAAGFEYDGLFATMVAEGGAAPVYGLYSAPTTGNNPTLLASQTSAAMAAVLKANPFGVAGTVGNSNNPAGFFATPMWVDVEIAQIGNTVSLRLNNSPVYTYNNTTGFNSGKIMLGYMDSFGSVGSAQSYVVIDNVRVVSVSGLEITSITDLGANVQIDFTFGLTASPASFDVVSAGTVTGTYASAGASVVQLTPGVYRATVAKNGDAQFYRIRLL